MFHTRPGDVDRSTINADELAEHPDLEGEEIYDFLARYVRKVHSDDFIRRRLKSYPQSSFVDVLMLSDIAYVIELVKNSDEMWDQNVRMKEIGLSPIQVARGRV